MLPNAIQIALKIISNYFWSALMTTNTRFNNQPAIKAMAALMLMQMLLGLLLNFYFLKPILSFDGSTTTDELNTILGGATIVALVISALNIVFGLLLPKAVTEFYSRTFTMLLAIATVGITLCAYEYAQLAEYVTFLTTYYQENSTLEVTKKLLASGRNEAHFLSIFISSLSLSIFYLLVLRAQLINQWLAYFALTATLLQLVAVGHTLFQAAIPNLLQLPLFICQLIVPIYLLVYGVKQSAEQDPQQQAALNQ